MKCDYTKTRNNAFTLTELLVVIAVVGLLALLFVPALAASKRKAARIGCVNNLKATYMGFNIWAGDNGDQLPFAVSVTNSGTMELAQSGDMVSTFQKVSRQLATTKILVCPCDVRQAAESWAVLAKTNLSYFLNVDTSEANPDMICIGDRNIVGGTLLTNGLTIFKSGDSAGWGPDMHHGQGDVGLADGSVAEISSLGLAAQITNSITRLTIP